MEQTTTSPPQDALTLTGRRVEELRLPVRFVRDPSSDRWSFHIEIPPLTGGGCGCREVAERSAFAALRRHLSRRRRPAAADERVGYLSVALGTYEDERPASGSTPPVPDERIARPAIGFHPHTGLSAARSFE